MCPKFHTNPVFKYTKCHISTNCLIFYSYVYYIVKNYLSLLQQIADMLKKIGLVETLMSALSHFNKIFGKLLHSSIYSHLSKFNLLGERKFGFRKNYSTSWAICNIYDELLRNVDEGKYSCCIFLRFK